jgi:hypothetical protein
MISENRFSFTGFVTLPRVTMTYDRTPTREGKNKFSGAFLLASADDGKTGSGFWKIATVSRVSTPLTASPIA